MKGPGPLIFEVLIFEVLASEVLVFEFLAFEVPIRGTPTAAAEYLFKAVLSPPSVVRD